MTLYTLRCFFQKTVTCMESVTYMESRHFVTFLFFLMEDAEMLKNAPKLIFLNLCPFWLSHGTDCGISLPEIFFRF